MKIIISEEMRFRHKVVEYAIKYNNNAEAARRYRTSRQQVQRWRKKYDGTIVSLANKSRRPHSHPNQHTTEEMTLIRTKYHRHKHEGLGQVYRKCLDAGYKRTYESMCRQLKKLAGYEKPKRVSFPKSRYVPLKATYPGQYVQMDVKYVPRECIGFQSEHERYYQITAIDLYSRKRIIKLVNENSSYETSKMLKTLESAMGFRIHTIQTDNGREFCNEREEKTSLFEKTLKNLGITHRRTRPYSPWQNGVVERSHKMDNDIFYNKRRFKSEEEMQRSFQRYSVRTNRIARRVLDFKTPNEMVEAYFHQGA